MTILHYTACVMESKVNFDLLNWVVFVKGLVLGLGFCCCFFCETVCDRVM